MGKELHTTLGTESIAALRNMRDELETLSEELKKEIGKLHDAYDENKDGLGSHASKIGALLEKLGEEVEEAGAPVKKLQKRLIRAAMIREYLIDNDSYGRSR